MKFGGKKMKFDEAVEMVKSFMNSGNAIHSPDLYLEHIKAVSTFLREYANNLFRNGNDINPDEMQTIGYIHDIGRCLSSSNRNGFDFHEYKGGVLLSTNGYGREADITRRHFLAYEKTFLLGEEELDGRSVVYNSHIQNSLESILLTFADLCIDNSGKPIKWEKKLKMILKRYRAGYLEHDIKSGVHRLGEMCRYIEKIEEECRK